MFSLFVIASPFTLSPPPLWLSTWLLTLARMNHAFFSLCHATTKPKPSLSLPPACSRVSTSWTCATVALATLFSTRSTTTPFRSPDRPSQPRPPAPPQAIPWPTTRSRCTLRFGARPPAALCLYMVYVVARNILFYSVKFSDRSV